MKSAENHYHHGDVENACIEAAFELLNEKGFYNLNLRAVTKRVGISHNAPYRYFRSKEELLVKLIIKIYGEIIEILDSVIETSTNKIEDDYSKLIRTFVNYTVNNKEKFRLLSFYTVQEPKMYPELLQSAFQLFARTHNLMSKYLKMYNHDSVDTAKFIIFSMATIRGYSTILVENKLDLALPNQESIVSNEELLTFITNELIRLTKLKNCPE